MAKVRIVEKDSLPWQPVHEAVQPETAAKMSPAEREADVCILHAGRNNEPQLFEVVFEPDEEVSLHAHPADEIIYVLEGEMIMGRKRLGPGASAFIAGHTLYGFRSGPEGLRFLNFRGDSNTHFITKQEFMAARKPREHRN